MNRIYEIYLLHKPNQDIHPNFITCLMLRFLIQGKQGNLEAFPQLRCEGKSLEAPCAALPLCLEYFFWAAWPDQPTSDIQAKCLKKRTHTVDGRHPAPVDMVNIPLFTGFYTSQVVAWDFFHQQYPSLFAGATIQNLQNLPDFEADKHFVTEKNRSLQAM